MPRISSGAYYYIETEGKKSFKMQKTGKTWVKSLRAILRPVLLIIDYTVKIFVGTHRKYEKRGSFALEKLDKWS
jgi:hypothetical protein